ncbi:TfoX/Sxy family protein [Fulvivirgaceae bacterium BMA10]|uniref:TfoX/Sxy family protein n=1 Tax=Splendidivirga corallicola TaxID=3051826 RepID=A0ABT8KNI8_9BACT|nr:TfoX/Sxy family protein [Fulvivirgaceae bacterium BMA10]
MAYDESLVNKVREALIHLPNVEEKKMFQGLTFMVDGKMCIGIRNEEIMCRIDPNMYESVLERIDCRPMIHGKRTIRGYVFVNEEGYKRKEDFDFWIKLALDFNKKAKASKKRKK